MISMLRGRVFTLGSQHIVLDVNGVGYLVFCSTNTIAEARSKKSEHEEVTILVETRVREDSIDLFGFHEEDERTWFKVLTTVKGVGGAIALQLLGALGVNGTINAIVQEDSTALKMAKGVGERLATRIISELKGKVSDQDRKGTAAGVTSGDVGSLALARSALIKLGFKSDEATKALNKAAAGTSGEASVETLVRQALANLNTNF